MLVKNHKKIERVCELEKIIPKEKNEKSIFDYDIDFFLSIFKKKKFFEKLKMNFQKNLFLRFCFFVQNNLNGNYRLCKMPFRDSVRDVFLHIKDRAK